MTKLAIIDFDGTLCSTHAAVRHVIGLTFDAFGRARPEAATIETAISSGVVVSEVFAQLLGEPPAHPIGQEWAERYREIYNSGEGLARTDLYPGVERGLQALTQAGWRCVVVSNKGIVALRHALSHFGMAGYFDLVVGDEPGLPRKPDPGTFRELIVPRFALGETSRVVMLGDTATDMLYAHNIGAYACWARYGFGDAESCLALKPDFILDSFDQIAEFAD